MNIIANEIREELIVNNYNNSKIELINLDKRYLNTKLQLIEVNSYIDNLLITHRGLDMIFYIRIKASYNIFNYTHIYYNYLKYSDKIENIYDIPNSIFVTLTDVINLQFAKFNTNKSTKLVLESPNKHNILTVLRV